MLPSLTDHREPRRNRLDAWLTGSLKAAWGQIQIRMDDLFFLR